MEYYIKGLDDYIAAIKRNQNSILMIGSVLFVLIVVGTFMMTSIYRSTATILIEQQEISQDIVPTVTSYRDQRIQMISQRVMTTPNLKKIVDKFNLYDDNKRETKSFFPIMEKMKEDIELEIVSVDVADPKSRKQTKATIAFKLSFSNKSPEIAQQVTNELVSLYLNENLKQRTESVVETTGFLKFEIEKLKEQIEKTGKELAVFKEKNASSLPELKQLNMEMLNRAEHQIIELDQQARALNERKLYLEAELIQLNPFVTSYSSTGERIFGSEDRLKSLRAEYTALSARYSDNHPDIIKMRREIATLEKEVGGITDRSEYHLQLKNKRSELSSLIERYSSEHPEVKKLKQQIVSLERELAKPVKQKIKAIKSRPDNPAYIQLQARLNSARAQLTSVRASRSRFINKIKEYEQRLTRTPQIEREYTTLLKTFENTTAKYQELQAKQMKADMAQEMEKGRKGERFTVIEPPILPEKPYKPQKLALISVGFLLSISVACGYAFLKEGLGRSVFSARELMRVTGSSPLAIIPYIETEGELEKKQKLQSRIILLIATFSVIVILLYLIVRNNQV